MAGLEISVGANIKDFQNKIKEVENDVQQLANEKAIQIKLGLDTKLITSQIRDAKKHLNDLKQTVRDTGNVIGKDFTQKTGNGGNALMQFSRIAQDAPFGIMGIGNNITATVEAFGHLQKSTGSAGSALKAVASSMLGSGGILLAVSLVTSGLTYMSQKGLTVGDVFRKLTGDFDQSRRSMQELSVETAKNAQAQISSVGAYVSAAKNINLSMEDRLLAVKKLQSEYPAYFGNLSKEQILNGDVANAVSGVTMALVAKAKAAATVDRIVKLAEEEEKLQNEINNALVSTAKQYKLTKKEAFEFAVVMSKQLRGEIDLFKKLEDAQGKGGTSGFTKAEKTALATLRISSGYLDASEKLINLRKEQDKYTDSLEKSVAASIKLETTKEKAGKKANVTPQVQGIDVAITQTGLDGLISLSGMVTQVAKNVQGAEGVIKTSMGNIPGYFDTSGQEALLSLQKFNEGMTSIIQNGIVESLSGMAEAIGSAFATGNNVISAVGKSLLSTLGSVLSELGKMCITTGIGILAIQTSLKTLNPYVAIAAGAALIALGGAVKGSIKNLGSSASSGGSSSGSGGYNTGASYSSPSSSSSGGGSSSSFGNGTVVFEIAGDRLIGVLQNTINKNKRLGGSLAL